MTSAPVRDPIADHLLTPENSAFLLIDYQPQQLVAVRSMDRALLVKNAVSTVRTIKTFEIPVVHSTVNVASGQGQPTLPELAGLLTDDKPLDRTTINSWEDIDFVQAVHATGRRKLIICALWTEICMAFTALDALREGYEVYPVVDAIGGTSPEAHRAGLGITFTTVLPRLTRLTDLGSPAVRAYAARGGQSEEEYLKQMGEPLTPEIAGQALLDLASAESATVAPAYLLTGTGLQKLP